jgi:hypothetical protein
MPLAPNNSFKNVELKLFSNPKLFWKIFDLLLPWMIVSYPTPGKTPKQTPLLPQLFVLQNLLTNP